MGTRTVHKACVHGHPRRWSEKSGRYVCPSCIAANSATWRSLHRKRKHVIPTFSTGSAK